MLGVHGKYLSTGDDVDIGAQARWLFNTREGVIVRTELDIY